MKTYIITGRQGISIHTGLVQLTKEQADKRPGKVAAVKDRPGVYEVKSPTMFKCGEKFGYDGVVSKVMMQEIVDEAEVKKKEAEKKGEAPQPVAPSKEEKKKGFFGR